MLLELFLSEIKHQCTFAKIAYNALISSLNSTNGDGVWLSLQAMLISSANISKILYPMNSKYDARGEELRRRLSISGNEKFVSREARNHFEHFDERLDTWYQNSKYHNIIDNSIGGDNFIKGGENIIDFMRFFNPQRFVFRFRDDEYEIQPLIQDVVGLLTKVDAELEQLRPHPNSNNP